MVWIGHVELQSMIELLSNADICWCDTVDEDLDQW